MCILLRAELILYELVFAMGDGDAVFRIGVIPCYAALVESMSVSARGVGLL